MIEAVLISVVGFIIYQMFALRRLTKKQANLLLIVLEHDPAKADESIVTIPNQRLAISQTAIPLKK